MRKPHVALLDKPHVALLALVAATIVALASLIQTYVSWQSRNDFLRATLISQTAQRCAEASTATLSYVSSVQQYRSNRADLDTALFYVIEKLAIIELVLSGQTNLTPGETDIGISQFRKLNDDISSTTEDPQFQKLAADAAALHAQVRANCVRILRLLSTK
jgi:hypothetical protein